MAEGLRGWTRPDMGRPTRFVMVRHGQTADSVRHLFSGSGGTDPELTELGHRQAQQAAQRVQESVAPGDFSVLFASPLRRTQQTAQYLDWCHMAHHQHISSTELCRDIFPKGLQSTSHRGETLTSWGYTFGILHPRCSVSWVAEFYRDDGSTVRLVNYGGGVVS